MFDSNSIIPSFWEITLCAAENPTQAVDAFFSISSVNLLTPLILWSSMMNFVCVMIHLNRTAYLPTILRIYEKWFNKETEILSSENFSNRLSTFDLNANLLIVLYYCRNRISCRSMMLLQNQAIDSILLCRNVSYTLQINISLPKKSLRNIKII